MRRPGRGVPPPRGCASSGDFSLPWPGEPARAAGGSTGSGLLVARAHQNAATGAGCRGRITARAGLGVLREPGPRIRELRTGVPRIRKLRTGGPRIGALRPTQPRIGALRPPLPRISASRRAERRIGEPGRPEPRISELRPSQPRVRELRTAIPPIRKLRLTQSRVGGFAPLRSRVSAFRPTEPRVSTLRSAIPRISAFRPIQSRIVALRPGQPRGSTLGRTILWVGRRGPGRASARTEPLRAGATAPGLLVATSPPFAFGPLCGLTPASGAVPPPGHGRRLAPPPP